jgi:hypothetical protein
MRESLKAEGVREGREKRRRLFIFQNIQGYCRGEQITVLIVCIKMKIIFYLYSFVFKRIYRRAFFSSEVDSLGLV